MGMFSSKRFALGKACLVAAIVLGVASHAAAGRRFLVSNLLFRIEFSKLLFNNSVIGLECEVTLEGSFHSRSISKVSGALIGQITRAVTGTCTGGTATFLNGAGGTMNTLPWHVRYDSFAGDLPNITRIVIQIVGLAVLLRDSGLTCLYLSTGEFPAMGTLERNSNGTIHSYVPTFTSQIRKHSGEPCESEIAWNIISSAGVVSVAGSTEFISFNLVA
jgi:hypothetical protein